MGTSTSAMVDPTVRFLGAHAQALSTLTRLRLLAQTVADMPLEQKTRLARDIVPQLSHLLEDHHKDEEQLLFPSMQSRASDGDEAQLVTALTARLTREHRALEALWAQIRPAVKALEAGRDVDFPVDLSLKLAQRYSQHTRFEETVVLPLAAKLLSISDKGAMDLSLALRHNVRGLAQYI